MLRTKPAARPVKVLPTGRHSARHFRLLNRSSARVRAALGATATAAGAVVIAGISIASSSAVAQPAVAAVIRPTAAVIPAAAPSPGARALVAMQPEVPQSYTVAPHDSLSSIAGQVYGQPGAWPVLYWANRPAVKWANDIKVGTGLKVPPMPATIPAAPAQLSPPAPRVVLAAAPSGAPAASGASFSGGSANPGGWSAYKLCVWSAESGRGTNLQNPTSTASGDFGFLTSTWYGITHLPGPAKDYSLATQSAAFDTLYAESGRSPWITDGC
jgi:hypothetical protein